MTFGYTDRSVGRCAIVVDGTGVSVACLATAANVNNARVVEQLFLAALAVTACIRTVFADKGHDATPNQFSAANSIPDPPPQA